MQLELTFKDLCASLKKDWKSEAQLLGAVDKLLGVALICSPLVLGPAAVALLPTLAVKNELTKLGTSVFEKVTGKKQTDYAARHETMQIAYGLLVFTAFFEAIDRLLPKKLRREIGLLASEKAFIARSGMDQVVDENTDPGRCEATEAPSANEPIYFPHPTETLLEQTERHKKLWGHMAQGFVSFLQKLAVWENADETKRRQVGEMLSKIEATTAGIFESQYFELARKFEDFAIWANLAGHKATKALLSNLSEFGKKHAAMSAATAVDIDVGFARLHAAVQELPELFQIAQAADIAAGLDRHYQARARDPIIESKDEPDDGKPRLVFPRVCDAFVPQAFRVLRQAGKARRLEEESTWKGLPRRNDLGGFLLSYLSSPYSVECPLLILGHPGSGKSLLTTVLSAQLASKHFTAIRVPLREVDADADIPTQIEEAVRKTTGISNEPWMRLSARFKNCPPLVILDGYDELLQASGQVFASYLRDAQRFQQAEAEQGRPVRIIVTSRVTLIDKAAVPAGATIVRLMEFDREQRDCWCEIWNNANAGYFKDSSVAPFVLPSDSEAGADRILTLAEQPLLLLMLALYDSESNRLRSSKGLDRTKLYDSLLRRFVTREREKEKGFEDASKRERTKALDLEMKRLGAAALGMYNRRKVHILSSELDEDLAFFRLEREVKPRQGRALSQADLLLGSFFFVHKSKTLHAAAPGDTPEEASAFEFLHNTFGEFLTADFIVRRAVEQVQTLRVAGENEKLRSVVEKMTGTADGFEKDWFASLVYTPLFTRPVVMEMMREWTPHVLADAKLATDGFIETLDHVVLNQIGRLLNKRELPSIIRKETAEEGYRAPFGDHPLLGHIAIYSMNLVLFRLIAGTRDFIFDEAIITRHEDGTRPWDRLIHVWRSWFSLSNLNGLTAAMTARRSGNSITVCAKPEFRVMEAKSRLEEYCNVALALGDDMAFGLSGYHLLRPESEGAEDRFQEIMRSLHSEGFDLGADPSLTQMLLLERSLPEAAEEFADAADIALTRSESVDEVERVCLTITRAIARLTPVGFHGGSSDPRSAQRMLDRILTPNLFLDIATRSPRSARILWSLVGELSGAEWNPQFRMRLLEDAVRRLASGESFSVGADYLVNQLLLIRDLGGGHFSFMHRHHFRVDPDMFARYLGRAEIGDIVEHRPDLALLLVQVLRQLGGRDYSGGHVERLMIETIRAIPPSRVLRALLSSPTRGVAYVRLLRDVDGAADVLEQAAKEIEPDELDRLRRPREVIEWTQRDPSSLLEYLESLQSIGSEAFHRLVLTGAISEILAVLLEPANLFDLAEQSPESGLRLVGLVRQLDFSEARRWLVAQTGRWDFHDPEALGLPLAQQFRRRPKAIGVWVGIARILEIPALAASVAKAVGAFLRSHRGARDALDALPISSLGDLRWLAETTEMTMLSDALAHVGQ